MRVAAIFLVLFFVHTIPLWNLSENLAGDFGDPLAHAALPGFYCRNILPWDLTSDQFLAPTGADLSTSFDSPFPMILTCPFVSLGTHAQFHLFAAMQILLVLVSGFMVARKFVKGEPWQLAYVLFVWWTGFYFARTHQHFTLLSGIWGFQILLWSYGTLEWQKWRSVLFRSALLGLVMSGTFHNVAMLSLVALALIGLSLWGARKRHVPTMTLFWHAIIGGAASLVVFTAFFGPAIVAYLTQALPRFDQDRSAYNLDLLSLWLPWAKNQLYEWFRLPQFLQIERTNPLDLLALILLLGALASRSFWKTPLFRVLIFLSVFYWVLALGPAFRFFDQEIGPNFIFRWLEGVPPLSISRTPGRLATVTVLTVIFLVFAFWSTKLAAHPRSRWLAVFLILWAFVTGPILNQAVFVPIIAYRSILPERGLESIRKSEEDSIVVSIPMAPAGDPSAYFLQIFHERRITGGYLSYTAYTAETLSKIAQDPFLRVSNCGGNPFQFTPTPFVTNLSFLKSHLLERKMRFMIINKRLILRPGCEQMLGWIRSLSKESWVETIEENNHFLVLAFQDHEN